MPSNPLVPQGNLNRLIGSITFPSFPNLNITAPYLGEAGISLAFDDDSTLLLRTMTGVVTSPQPYVLVTVTANLLKPQSLAQAFENQRLTQSNIGNFSVRLDTNNIGPFNIQNGAIQTVRELTGSGRDAGYNVVFQGAYPLNDTLWNLT